MGIYLNRDMPPIGKADKLIEDYDAIEFAKCDIENNGFPTDGTVVICVVNNGPFDAAGVLDTEYEFKYWIEGSKTDTREHRWLIMDKNTAEELIA